MVLLAADSLLLFFTTYFTGIAGIRVLKKWTGLSFNAGMTDIFLAGLLVSFIWFNLLSFVAPVDYRSLLPLLLTACMVFAQRHTRQSFFQQLAANTRLLLRGPNAFLTIAFLGVFFVYWIVPPANPDSAHYHYVAIRWYEQYKVIPGLANIYGRLSFNPASFIISAAYSFTGPAGQSLYPLNGMLVLVLYGWLLKKIVLTRHSAAAFVLMLCAILLFRNFLGNISSPSSDPLATLLIVYTGFRVYENLREGKNSFAAYLPLFFFLIFAVTAKLFALSLGLLFVYTFFFVIRDKKKYRLLFKTLPLLLLLLAPWLIRNIVLCGSLAYPLLHTNIFDVNWAAPQELFRMEYTISKYQPAMTSRNIALVMHESFFPWFFSWMQYTLHTKLYTFLIYTAAFLSPLSWFLTANRKYIPGPLFIVWVINYTNVWVWLCTSPEARFGLPFHVLSIGLPLLTLLEPVPATTKKWYIIALPVSWTVCIGLSFYILSKKSTYPFSLSDCWLKPLRDYRYYRFNDKKNFPYKQLGNGVKLYYADSTHLLLNADLPCMPDTIINVEMRGPRIENGFRATGNCIKKLYPFVK